MAVGVTVCIATFYYKYNGVSCDVQDDNLFWGYVAKRVAHGQSIAYGAFARSNCCILALFSAIDSRDSVGCYRGHAGTFKWTARDQAVESQIILGSTHNIHARTHIALWLLGILESILPSGNLDEPRCQTIARNVFLTLIPPFPPVLLRSAMMYASYFALFAEFLVKRYFFSKPKSKKTEGKPAPLKKEE